MSMPYDVLVGIDTVNPTTQAFEVLSCDLKASGSHHDPSGLRGIRDHQSERVRGGNTAVRGTIEMEPSPEEWALLLPWILGGTPVGTSFPIADVLSSRFVQVDRVAKVHTYASVYVNSATIRGSEGLPVSLSLDLIGTTETEGNAGTFPAITPLNTPPFMFAEGVLTLLSSARSFQDFTLTINNALDVKFFNSPTATRIRPTDRIVTFDAMVPYDTVNADLYNQAVAGAAATLVFTPPAPHAGYSMTVTFGTLQFPHETPTISGRSELMLPLRGVARRLSTTPSIAFTLDSTP
jgi:hypothetical protein